MVTGWFYMTYVLSFVKCDMFMCEISNKDAYSQFVFEVIDPIKGMEVWIKVPAEVLIADELSHWRLWVVSFDGEWYDAIVSKWYF